jgi:hypothetical protein
MTRVGRDFVEKGNFFRLKSMTVAHTRYCKGRSLGSPDILKID